MSTQLEHELESSNAWLHDLPMLRNKLKEDGYLFFRGILDVQALEQIREDMLEIASEYGYVNRDAPLADGIYSGQSFPTSTKFETSPIYRRILELPRFNAFGSSPVLSLLLSGLLDSEIQEHRRRIGRITLPGSFKNTTPPHQDYFYIKGTPDTFTCWIPAGNCPGELGGLAVMPKSNHLGMLEHEPMQGTGGHGVSHERCEQLGLPWLTTDFRIGDLLMFHGHTLHKALDNRTEDRLRVSLEYRFQRKEDEIDPGSMDYHMKGAFDK
ncbi:phytanoyl-CoA dioxygenase family protein [Cohnella silvisoli]|uniref:Phytanoyl-CoA dioxygenase family protein n=1 Tax=Cohnella silvisoli TaxID=2873699 RepID=A0ABV1KUB3_9BACL|nr:phytanoyl-CoA dioxygenase family protein [Cohnella silvisoli]MCD9023164.1 phytanoyl-CoA dioxygenase family protein [Cohnella silvisoli]